MKTVVYMISLKKDGIEEYKRYHRNVWPEVLEGLRAVGIRENRLFLLGSRLINLMEVDDDFDPEAVFSRYHEGRPRVAEWDRLMIGFQEPVPEARPGEWWAQMEPIFEYEVRQEEEDKP